MMPPNREPQPLRSTVDHFVLRLLTECIDDAARKQWLKRAAAFENARPKPDDFHGQATPEELRRRWRELTEIANACRARAKVAPLDEIAPEAEQVWGEAS